MCNKKYYIGTLSGTSIDAIDAALVSFQGESIELIATYSHAFPIHLRQRLQQLCVANDQANESELVQFGLAEREFSLATAAAVQQLLQQTGFSAQQITAIGAHGQTVRHHPELTPAFSLQLGCAATLACATDIAVISHFRQKDIALGGQGAPLAPALHHALFYSPEKNRAIINLGGIANISYLPTQGQVIGFDSGPANTLLDAWYQKHQKGRFDHKGQWATTGQVNQALLTRFLADPYFQQAPPKSTGREYFTLAWLEKNLQAHTKQHRQTLAAADIQASLVALTATSVVQAFEQFAPVQQAFLCGGGAHNLALTQALAQLAPHISWHSTALLGVDPNWVEAMLFAWLAHRYMQGLTGSLTAVTGAKRPAILGSYTPAG